MARWISVDDRMPDEETVCLVAKRFESRPANHHVYQTYPLSVSWDGTDWTDIDGEKVTDVAYWMELPRIKPVVGMIEKMLEKMDACSKRDTCEKTDCCYFTTQKELSVVLEYIKELEGKQ